MTPIVEASVTEAKLALLLGEQCESSSLDFKSILNPNEQRDIVELAKDVAAMQRDGGYIVIGANDDGTPSGTFSLPSDNRFDESVLRRKLERFLQPVVDLRVARHSINGSSFVLIYVGQNTTGITVMCSDGSYAPHGDSRVKMVFRRGDVFVRNGTSSERWQTADSQVMIENVIQRRKEEWRRERAEEMQHEIRAGIGADRVATAPVTAYSWDLDLQTMRDALIELLRRRDEIPARVLLQSTSVEIARVLRVPPVPLLADYLDILDRVVCHLATAVQLDVDSLRELALSALRSVYQDVSAFQHWPPTQGKAKLAARMWLEIVARVQAVGALAIRIDDWASVRSLTLQPPPTDELNYYSSWTRHALVECNRANVQKELEGQEDQRNTLLTLQL